MNIIGRFKLSCSAEIEKCVRWFLVFILENPWPKVKPDPPNTAGQLHNVLLKAFFDDKRRLSGDRSHARTQPGFDVVDGIEHLSVSQEGRDSETMRNKDSEPVKCDNEGVHVPPSDKTDEVINEIMSKEGKADSNEQNIENKKWNKK